MEGIRRTIASLVTTRANGKQAAHLPCMLTDPNEGPISPRAITFSSESVFYTTEALDKAAAQGHIDLMPQKNT